MAIKGFGVFAEVRLLHYYKSFLFYSLTALNIFFSFQYMRRIISAFSGLTYVDLQQGNSDLHFIVITTNYLSCSLLLTLRLSSDTN